MSKCPYPGINLFMALMYGHNINIPMEGEDLNIQIHLLAHMLDDGMIQFSGWDNSSNYTGTFFVKGGLSIFSTSKDLPSTIGWDGGGGENSFTIKAADRLDLAMSFTLHTDLLFKRIDGSDNLKATVVSVGHADNTPMYHDGNFFVVIRTSKGEYFRGLWEKDTMILTPIAPPK